ncbi:MAG: DUF5683 domain-containing protein [Marinifilaceae bacterium]
MNRILPKYILGVVCFILLIPSNSAFSQIKREPKLSMENTTAIESVVITKPHSPHKATIYSALLPGLGQIYNKKYWKVPILYAGIGVTIYAINWNTKQYKKYLNGFGDFTEFLTWKNGQEDPTNPTTPAPTADSYLKILDRNFIETDSRTDEWFQTTLRQRKDSYKKDRDLSYIILAGIYVLNIIDATVDAHFFDFNVNDNLSLKVEPAVNYTADTGNTMGLKCSIKF